MQVRRVQSLIDRSPVVPYLLVVANQDEVLARFTQGGDGVSLKNLCGLLYDHQPWLHFLQECSELGCPGCCHANNLANGEFSAVYLYSAGSQQSNASVKH